jgi:ketosteroid isomerase-like protein
MECLEVVPSKKTDKVGESMKRFRIASTIFVACFTVACVPPAPKLDLDAEAQSVRETSAAWFAAEVRHDLDAALSYLTPDAVIQAGDVPTMDKSGMRSYWEAFFQLPYTDIPLTEPRAIVVADSGEIAYDVGPWKVVLDGEDRSSDLYGKSTIIWRKADGEWKAVLLSFSLDAPSVAATD